MLPMLAVTMFYTLYDISCAVLAFSIPSCVLKVQISTIEKPSWLVPRLTYTGRLRLSFEAVVAAW